MKGKGNMMSKAREKFLRELKNKLFMQMSKKEISKILDEYNEYFDKSENEEEAIKELGDISLIAEEIIHPNPFIANKKLKVRLVLSIFIIIGLFFYLSVWFSMPMSESFVVTLWLTFTLATVFIGKDEIFEIKINSKHQKNMCVFLSIFLGLFIAVSLGIVFYSSNVFLNEVLTGSRDLTSWSYNQTAIFTDIGNLRSIISDTQALLFILIGAFSVLILKIGKNAVILGFFNILYLYSLSLISEFIYSVDLNPSQNPEIINQQLNYIGYAFMQSFILNIICFSVITIVLFMIIKKYRSEKYAYTA